MRPHNLSYLEALEPPDEPKPHPAPEIPPDGTFSHLTPEQFAAMKAKQISDLRKWQDENAGS